MITANFVAGAYPFTNSCLWLFLIYCYVYDIGTIDDTLRLAIHFKKGNREEDKFPIKREVKSVRCM